MAKSEGTKLVLSRTTSPGFDAVPSSSGPGRLVLIQKIAGSTPAGITKERMSPRVAFFLWWSSAERREPAGFACCHKLKSLTTSSR